MFKRVMVVGLVVGMLLAQMACEKTTAVARGLRVSVGISAGGVSQGEAILRVYRENKIDLVAKDKFFKQLEAVGKGGRLADEALAVLVARFPDGRLPASERTGIDRLLSESVTAPASEIGATVNGLSGDAKKELLMALVFASLQGKAAADAIKGRPLSEMSTASRAGWNRFDEMVANGKSEGH